MTRARRLLWVWILVAVMAATLAGRWVDVPRLFGPDIKGDWATYVAMSLSLAHDGDLRYERVDYERFVRLFPSGPSGIFLKTRYTLGLTGKTPVPTTQSLAYGKALIYPLVAAPFVAIGGIGGMLVLNWLLLGVCVYCGVCFCGARAGPWGRLIGVAFILATIVPVYATWLTPEIFNFALVFVAYFLWLYKKVAPADERTWLMHPATTIVAAVLLGVATYSKITHAVLIAPLVLDALVARRLVASGALVLAFAAGSAGLFGVNALISGEANYQGAATLDGRRSFYDHYPFDNANTPFEERGSAMVTNDADTGRVLAPEAIAQIPINVFYFFAGRHAGFLPYYFPGAVILGLWLANVRRASFWQWMTLGAVAGSVMALIVFAPDSWNGGGGPPGNRYVLSLYPPLLFLLPAGVGVWSGVLAAVVGVAFTGAMVLRPFAASAAPWVNVDRAPLRWLPIELTLINDLPVFLNRMRGGIRFVPEPTVQVYYMNGNTYSAEGQGFWIAGGATAETIVKMDKHPSHVRFTFSAPIANDVWGSFEGRPIRVSVPAGEERSVQVSPPLGFKYHMNRVYLLRLTTRDGFVPSARDPRSTDTRNLGVFVKVEFFYD